MTKLNKDEIFEHLEDDTDTAFADFETDEADEEDLIFNEMYWKGQIDKGA